VPLPRKGAQQPHRSQASAEPLMQAAPIIGAPTTPKAHSARPKRCARPLFQRSSADARPAVHNCIMANSCTCCRSCWPLATDSCRLRSRPCSSFRPSSRHAWVSARLRAHTYTDKCACRHISVYTRVQVCMGIGKVGRACAQTHTHASIPAQKSTCVLQYLGMPAHSYTGTPNMHAFAIGLREEQAKRMWARLLLRHMQPVMTNCKSWAGTSYCSKS